jgi:hypothetical protein
MERGLTITAFQPRTLPGNPGSERKQVLKPPKILKILVEIPRNNHACLFK